ALLSADDQALVAGFIVNKFRGDPELLAPGSSDLERVTGRRIFGTLPWHPDLWLDSEDALDLAGRRSSGATARRVAVIRPPRMSNFTDVDALGLEPDLDVVFVSDPRAVGDADLVVLPGTRATIADLVWLRSRGLDQAVLAHAAAGKPVLGICGGFQMLGRAIRDPDGVESPVAEVEGLGLLDVETRFAAAKVLRLPRGTGLGVPASGYEIHHGRLMRGDGADEFLGGVRAGQVFGTMWHGALEGDGFRDAFLRETLGLDPSGISFPAAREHRLDLLGDLVEEHLDVTALSDLISAGPPTGLSFLPPGAPS
ncbi:MAG: cobyric acid synthase, partial [Mycobacterium sp.]